MKKIGFITTPLNSGDSVRGVGFYTKNLLENLKFLASKYDLVIAEDNFNVDLIHYPYFNLFSHTLPIFRVCRTVVTIHDVIPLEFPDHYPPGIKGSINLQLQKLALSGVERVITDSYASLKSIRKYLRVPHHKLKLVYLASDKRFKKIKSPRNKFNLPAKFVLYVGDVNYNKNIPNLIKACKMAELPLIIVGKVAAEVEKMDLSHPELRHLQGVDWSNVTKLGFVTDSDLVDIYNLATVYCQPSFAEGFGLPVLEAMACGTPVACSNVSSLPELGGDMATYFDPGDVGDMVKALKTAKSRNSKEWLSKFSWEKTAKETLKVYREVI